MDPPNVCKIKAEFILPEAPRELVACCVSDKDLAKLENDAEEVPAKKARLSKSEKKKLRGANKARGPTVRADLTVELCNTLVNLNVDDEVPKCERKNCQFIHDIDQYLQIKPKDIGESCYNFDKFGKCPRGLACRFGTEHIASNRNKIDEEKSKQFTNQLQTLNQLQHELQVSLRKKTYDFSISEKLIKHNDDRRKEPQSGAVTDEDIVKLLLREKKKIDWNNKLVLSPLTTVGNLPFRRICKEFGADITCGEMAMCSSLLQGAPQEWALIKRHHTEDIFGVQLCANNPHVLTKCGQLLEKEAQIDFIDFNLGCPIELVCKEGAGCGLLRRQRLLEACVRNLSEVLTIPLTVKTRTGLYSNENLAHILAPKFRDWGVSLITIHGRSREQRYTKLANWEYIREVAQAAAPLPVFGNGDVLNYYEYTNAKENCPELAGVMIGRGALIKPWIFEEIKGNKLWDISSGERFEILKKYTNYGLEHWGSDNKGVENTRRFLLEWLSFLYRYVPVGLLEHPPQKINERPPYYKGRDELETLFASPSAADWIKISEMLLGPVPDNFKFLPKHKANSYK